MTRNAKEEEGKEEAGKEEAGKEEERISTCVINPRVRGTSASVLLWQVLFEASNPLTEARVIEWKYLVKSGN